LQFGGIRWQDEQLCGGTGTASVLWWQVPVGKNSREKCSFTSQEVKYEEAKALGAHQVVSSQDTEAIRALAGSLDFLLITANVPLDWSALLVTLAPQGRLHFLGLIPEAVAVVPFDLILTQRSISGSPVGPPVSIAEMLQFAARHHIAPVVEHLPMSQVNEAMEHLQAGKARYHIVLETDGASRREIDSMRGESYRSVTAII